MERGEYIYIIVICKHMVFYSSSYKCFSQDFPGDKRAKKIDCNCKSNDIIQDTKLICIILVTLKIKGLKIISGCLISMLCKLGTEPKPVTSQ